MTHSASPQSQQAVIVAWFWSFGTDGRTLCVKIVTSTGQDCGSIKLNSDMLFASYSKLTYFNLKSNSGSKLASKIKEDLATLWTLDGSFILYTQLWVLVCTNMLQGNVIENV